MAIKHRGRIRLTSELAKGMFALPESVEIQAVQFDVNRNIVEVYITSDEEVEQLTFPTREGQQVPDVNLHALYGEVTPLEYRIYERVRNILAGVEEGEGISSHEDDLER